jgi:hypothetical protein
MITTSARRVSLAVGAALAIACGGSSATGPAGTVTGTYSAQSFNGKPLPYAESDTTDGVVYTTTFDAPFTISLNTDKTARMVYTLKINDAGTVQTFNNAITGTWSIVGNAVDFATDDGDHLQGTWNGSDMLTINDPPYVVIFRK